MCRAVPYYQLQLDPGNDQLQYTQNHCTDALGLFIQPAVVYPEKSPPLISLNFNLAKLYSEK